MPWTQELSWSSFLLHTSAPSLPHCHLFLNFINAFSRVCRSPRGNRSKSLDIHFCLLLLLLFLCTTCANTPSPPHSGPCRDAQAQLSFPIASPQIRQLTGSAPAVELCLGRNQRNRSHGDDTVTAALLQGVSVADVGSEKQNWASGLMWIWKDLQIRMTSFNGKKKNQAFWICLPGWIYFGFLWRNICSTLGVSEATRRLHLITK